MTPTPSSSLPGASGLFGLLPLIRGDRRLKLLLTLCSGILAQGGTLATMATLAWIAGRAIGGAAPETLVPAFLVLVIVVPVAAGGRWWQAHISHDFAFTLIGDLQIGIYDGLERAAPASILGRRTGELASVATGDAELMEMFYAHTLADYVGAVIVPLAALAGLAAIHPLAALTLLPFLLLVASVPAWLSRRAGREGEKVLGELGHLNAETVEFIQSQRELSLFGRGRDALAKLMARTAALGAAQRRYGSRAGLEYAAIDALTALAVLAAALVGLMLLGSGAIGLPLLPLIIVLSGGALAPIAEVTQTARKLGELKAGARRILEIFHQKPQIPDTGTQAVPSDTTIRFEDVGFGYDGGRGAVLNGFNCAIRPGETVALVGRSGAGKSTVANLLMRFWDPERGRVSIGGIDIRDLPVPALRRLVAWVPQDIHLFNRTIADNIRLGRPEATDDEVIRAARLAQAHDFIAALPEGYDTLCGERAARLSGGQRQRLAIARALLTGAPILLLDEASSNLDTANERAFQRAFEGIRGQGRTVIMIAHRPSMIRSAERILVLDSGRLAEAGTHAELAASGALYRQLMTLEEAPA
ncbi:ABC transporter ATP-binding protein [Hoeflea olei]|uniref:ABC transporter n=1 Tax=Hoeflea olei TaxID=1480615 RepID=A0A1C1YQ54_9HYPH|nr:ABC transporter ATP-binding protein [Hoeflea olei]OCW55507.1 ABC transporter [Hoeflea olei]